MERCAAWLVRASEEAVLPENAERDGPRMPMYDGMGSALGVSSGEGIGDMADVDTLRRCLGRIYGIC